MTEILFTGILNLNLIYQLILINITAILIQRTLVFQAKILLFMTFWTHTEPYHMLYIIRNVTLKLTEHWNCLYSAVT